MQTFTCQWSNIRQPKPKKTKPLSEDDCNVYSNMCVKNAKIVKNLGLKVEEHWAGNKESWTEPRLFLFPQL